jgi:hypothetical protein
MKLCLECVHCVWESDTKPLSPLNAGTSAAFCRNGHWRLDDFALDQPKVFGERLRRAGECPDFTPEPWAGG